MQQSCRVAILVKALPQPSSRYGETVCCAGVTLDREWKRLYPVRFRHLSGQNAFKRWDIVSYDYGRPKQDIREESCHVHEESIRIEGALDKPARVRLLSPLIIGSAEEAMSRGQSLALIRPRNPRFRWKVKPQGVIDAEKAAFDRAARQIGMFDESSPPSIRRRTISASPLRTTQENTHINVVIGKPTRCSGTRAIGLAQNGRLRGWTKPLTELTRRRAWSSLSAIRPSVLKRGNCSAS